MIEIHQAIFGEGRDRGHALLGSSFPSDTIPNQVSGYTDLVDRPRDGELVAPVTRAFLAKEHFLLVRSFPDLTGRQGRVFSHALILSKDDYLKVTQITALLTFLMSEANKDVQLTAIDFSNAIPRHTVEPSFADHMATAGLVDHINVENTIVWLQEAAYWNWIGQIWPMIPDPVKLNVRLGAAFNPNKVNTGQLNLLYLPEAAKNNWQREKFLIIDETTATAMAPGPLNDYLLGKGQGQDALTDMLGELNLRISEIDDLRVLARYASIYGTIAQEHPVKELLMLSGVIAHYNPAARSALAGKKKILMAIASAIPKAKAEEISYLQHQTWAGFDEPDVETLIGSALKAWLDVHLLTQDNGLEKAKLAVTALKGRKRNWWHIFTTGYIKQLLQHWKSTYADHWWTWVKADLDAAAVLFPLLPDQAEQAIVERLPNLDKPGRTTIIELSAGKKWYHLYGMTALAHLPPKDALAKVVAIVPAGIKDLILKQMTAKIADQALIAAAADLNDERLNEFAAQRIVGIPGLKKGIELRSEGWQQIWLSTLKKGVPLWAGIQKPQVSLFAIADMLIIYGQFNEVLLSEISRGPENSLKDYPQRNAIWDVLPAGARPGFLSATLVDCFSDINKGKLRLTDLEKPLRDSLESPAMLQKMISDPLLNMEVKLELFNTLPGLGEADAGPLLRNHTFSEQEAKTLGRLISLKRWSNLASSIFSQRRSRPDLEPALRQCYPLLGFWERLNLAASGFGTHTVSADEGWEMLLQKVIDHYPDGPKQNGIWENAGGKRSELHTSGSGKQIWTSAIAHMKRGGHPKPKKLLSKMIEEFPYDSGLKELNQLL